MTDQRVIGRGHVLHVITGLGVGGAERTLLSLVPALASRGWGSTVVSLKGGDLAGRLRQSGAAVEVLGVDRLGGAPRVAWAIRRLADRCGAALVQGWMYHGNLAALAGASRRRPVLWNVRHALHDLDREPRGTRLAIRVGALLSSHSAAIIYNSAASAEQHAGIGYAAHRAAVIPNGFDFDRFRPTGGLEVRHALGIPRHAPVVGWVGRDHPIKGLGIFLELARAAVDQVPDLHVVLAGRGTGAAALAASLDRLGLAARTRRLGEVDDVAGVLAALDVFCLTSWSEAFPNVLAEAMLCGVPCVASDVGDVGRILGETGTVVPRGDAAAAAAAAIALLRRPAEERRKLGLAGRQRVVRDFGLDRMAEAYCAAYGRAVAP